VLVIGHKVAVSEAKSPLGLPDPTRKVIVTFSHPRHDRLREQNENQYEPEHPQLISNSYSAARRRSRVA
jgi:hypothetical protein